MDTRGQVGSVSQAASKKAVARRRNIGRAGSWSLTIFGASLTTFASTFLGYWISSDDAQKSFWILFTSVGVVLGIAVGLVPQVMAGRAENRRTKAVIAFNDALGDVHRALGVFIDSEAQIHDQRVFFRSMLSGGVNLLGREGVRLCVYMLDSRDSQQPSEDPVLDYTLRLEDFAGRNDEPRPEFDPGTEHGAQLIRATLERQQVTVLNRDVPPITLDFHPGTVWRSFFTVPLISGKNHQPLGVLMVDTRSRTDFTDDDITVGFTLAKLIVLGLNDVVGAARDTKPEASEAVARLESLQEIDTPRKRGGQDR